METPGRERDEQAVPDERSHLPCFVRLVCGPNGRRADARAQLKNYGDPF